jgi:hypothetical protein
MTESRVREQVHVSRFLHLFAGVDNVQLDWERNNHVAQPQLVDKLQLIPGASTLEVIIITPFGTYQTTLSRDSSSGLDAS